MSKEQIQPELVQAAEAFHPSRFGFEPHGTGWKKEVPGLGTMAIASLSWEHAQLPVYDMGDGTKGNALEYIARLQQDVWGMPPGDTVPSNVGAIIRDTGGSLLVAYDLAKGFTPEGWLGFAIGFGSSSGTLVSHMVGVREDMRGAADIGWHIKVVQAHEAIKTGHDTMQWTYDPMRGANARLNLEKLGGTVDHFTIDKYGPLRTELYGDVPTDRFTVAWDLASPRVHQRIANVYARHYKGARLEDVMSAPTVTSDNVAAILAARPEMVTYQIPGDIDVLMRSNEQEAYAWRREMRTVFSSLLHTSQTQEVEAAATDPALLQISETDGGYHIIGFATGETSRGRQSRYILQRKS